MQRFLVNNVEEAVELALNFREERRYDWFRGQLKAEWLPSSSLERAIKGGGSQAELEKRLTRFLGWARTEPTVRYLADPVNRDQLFAVLQHYGFPTSYIDFSTDPGIAGFFSADCTKAPEAGTVSAIFCLNSADLRRFYDQSINPHFKENLEIDLVSVDVDNLWRLQAQAGHFVFANHNWYQFYDMDRIEFPWTGYPSFPPKSRIYPEHSSALEQILNNYFEDERRVIAHENFMRDQRERAARGVSAVKHVYVTSKGYDSDVFDAPPAMLPSWSKEALKPWLEAPAEAFHQVVGFRQSVILRDGLGVPSADKQLTYGIATALRQDPSLRLRAVQWELHNLPSNVDQDRMETLVRTAWNGMRRLPYADEDIAMACGALLALCAQPDCMSTDSAEILRAFQAWQPDAMEVEFGAPGDTGSRGYCSAADLRQVISLAWLKALPAGSSAEAPRAALRLCHIPDRMLDFPAFATMFGRQLIPSQLIRERKLVHFNPARLDVFGLP
jgi:hypothetical protein